MAPMKCGIVYEAPMKLYREFGDQTRWWRPPMPRHRNSCPETTSSERDTESTKHGKQMVSSPLAMSMRMML